MQIESTLNHAQMSTIRGILAEYKIQYHSALKNIENQGYAEVALIMAKICNKFFRNFQSLEKYLTQKQVIIALDDLDKISKAARKKITKIISDIASDNHNS